MASVTFLNQQEPVTERGRAMLLRRRARLRSFCRTAEVLDILDGVL